MNDIARRFNDEIISGLQDKERIRLQHFNFEKDWVREFVGDHEKKLSRKINESCSRLYSLCIL